MIFPQVIGYDVVCATSGVIHGRLATRDEADAASAQIEWSIVIPILKTNTQRVGYAIRQGASS